MNFSPRGKMRCQFLFNASDLCLFQEAAQSGGRIAPCTVLSVCLPLLWPCDTELYSVLSNPFMSDAVTKKII